MELREARGIVVDVGRKELQRDGKAKAEIVGAINLAHAAAAQPSEDAIARIEDGPRRKTPMIDIRRRQAAGRRREMTRRLPVAGYRGEFGRRNVSEARDVGVPRQGTCARGARRRGELRVGSTRGAARHRAILVRVFDILTANTGMLSVDTVQIPNRSLFRQPEVCEIAQVQPYVLRSWEAEFPDLGVSKSDGGPRVYRKADVERVLRIKQLLFVEGLTLAGVRRRMQEEQGPLPSAPPLDDLLTRDARERILSVRKSLRDLASMLSRTPAVADGSFELAAPPARAVVKKKPAKPVKKRGR